MKRETIKSVTLAILVAISLFLTFGLWSYQPNFKFLPDMNYAEADIGGNSNIQKRDLVVPKSITFHLNQRIYGFSNPSKATSLYHDMHHWTLYNTKEEAAKGPPKNDERVEFVFPDQLPVKLIDSLFSLDKKVKLPNWSFQHMYITFDENSTLNVQFLSTNGKKRITASINNEKWYKQLWAYMTDQSKLSEYMEVNASNANKPPIYIPKHSQKVEKKKLAMKDTNPSDLVDVLFSNPETVRRDKAQSGETFYTDGFHGMRVRNDGKSISFFNPVDDDYERMDPVDLLDTSRKNINEQKGWTGDFNLESLNSVDNLISYRMFYKGYPVFDHNLASIEQEWHDEDLYKYNRPTAQYRTQPGDAKVKVPSGQEVDDYLKQDADIKQKHVKDVRLGYHMEKDEQNPSVYVTLTPTWYMLYDDHWEKLDIGDEKKGGH